MKKAIRLAMLAVVLTAGGFGLMAGMDNAVEAGGCGCGCVQCVGCDSCPSC
jgi:hypothetical protein